MDGVIVMGVTRRGVLFGLAGGAAGLVLAKPGQHALAGESSRGIPGPVVRTSSGRYRGLTRDGVQVFRGMRYGAPAGGELRFAAPAPYVPHRGVIEAVEIPPRCPQVDSRLPPAIAALNPREVMDEDCLSVTVWAPARREPGVAYPTMVWLHGGAYSSGSCSWAWSDGAELARRHGVVVVGINHRLNLFGYLDLGSLGAAHGPWAANAGQLDIVLALRWVQRNIEAFGGSPDNVTLFGHSGGAGKISALLAMPAARGLYHKVILQSGSLLRAVRPDEAAETAARVLDALELTPQTAQRLRDVPWSRLVEVLAELGPALRLAPSLDPASLPFDPFDPASPGSTADLPMLAGTTATESTWFSWERDPVEPDRGQLVAEVYRLLSLDDAAAASELVEVYRGDHPGASHQELLALIATDTSGFRRGVNETAERKAQQQSTPVFKYRFEWQSPDPRLRAIHGIELPFVFDSVRLAPQLVGDASREVLSFASEVAAAWTGFARTGQPLAGRSAGEGAAWLPFSRDARHVMLVDRQWRAAVDPYASSRAALLALSG